MMRIALIAAGILLAAQQPAGAVFPETDSAVERPPIWAAGVKAIEDGEYAKGLEIMRSFVEEDPKDADSWSLVGFSLRKLKRYVDSEHAYQQALDINPKHLAANAYAGALYLETGRVLDADKRLAVLDELCKEGKGCEDREKLAGMIESFRKTGKVSEDW
ncbi:MAG: tetratricopeptide repeat protein [Nisaea sp.]|jgi:tetratricopeptide (TPR) repeat protein|uniref:tetratricopeptide repeat protein n=1 Tax=Nisaea sp. TaxID=2024842 RepID=UPI001AFDE653|nr:tetratricopeptide repeat protein [Nisaea sp.]MBO6561492.1 tetratricopeptide repeat protein [Nisaea sp.]